MGMEEDDFKFEVKNKTTVALEILGKITKNLD